MWSSSALALIMAALPTLPVSTNASASDVHRLTRNDGNNKSPSSELQQAGRIDDEEEIAKLRHQQFAISSSGMHRIMRREQEKKKSPSHLLVRTFEEQQEPAGFEDEGWIRLAKQSRPRRDVVPTETLMQDEQEKGKSPSPQPHSNHTSRLPHRQVHLHNHTDRVPWRPLHVIPTATLTQDEQGQAPEINCKWFDWDPWTNCTKTCGSGITTRHRSKEQDAQNGGTCTSNIAKEEEKCNEEECPTTTTTFPATTAAPKDKACERKGAVFVSIFCLAAWM